MTNPTYETPFAAALAAWEEADKTARDFAAELERMEQKWDAAHPGPAPLAILNLDAHSNPVRNGAVITRPPLQLSSDPADLARDLPRFTAFHARVHWEAQSYPALVVDSVMHSLRWPRGGGEAKPRAPSFIAERIAHDEARKAYIAPADERHNALWCEEWTARQAMLATPAATPADLALKLDVFTLQAVDGYDWDGAEAALQSVMADVARILGNPTPTPALSGLRKDSREPSAVPVERAA